MCFFNAYDIVHNESGTPQRAQVYIEIKFQKEVKQNANI